jgi:hypothetical protein
MVESGASISAVKFLAQTFQFQADGLHPAVQFYDYCPVIGFWGEDYSKIIPRSQKK